MNENINLCEILKDCPKGTIFYSPLFGKVNFQTADDRILTRTVLNDSVYFLPNGSFSLLGMASPEVMLFPSYSQRDWSKWKCPKPKFDPKTLKPFDRVLVRGQVGLWSPALFTYLCDVPPRKELMMDNLVAKYVIPYNDDTKHLVGTSDEAPEFYRYWED